MFYIYANGKSIYQPMDHSLALISPKLTLEMGKAGSIQFGIPPNNQYYRSLQQLKTSVSVEMDDTEIFRGRVLSVNRGFQNIKTVYCEGDLAYLVDSVQMGKKYTGKAHDLFRRIVSAHNARVEASKQFAAGNITVENRDVLLAGRSDDIEDAETGGFDYKQIALNSIADEWHTTFDFIEECLINPIGGYLRTRRSGSTIYLDWLKDYESTAIQEIEFGKNLLDLTQEISSEDVFTVLIPLGDENLTVASVNNGSDELVDDAAVTRYGRIVKTHVFDSVNQPQTLLENGKRYLASHANVPITITVRAVDMHLIDPNARPIRVGDRVRVHSIAHDVADYLICTKIEYDLENPANNTYTFGIPKQSMTERYRKDRSKQAAAVSRTGRASGGAAGGAAETQAKKSLDKFYDAWVNPNAEAGTVSIYGIYHELKNSIAVLKNEIGIDINAPDGTLNLKNLRIECDEQGKALREQAAQINMLNNETTTKLELIVSRHNALEDKENGHYAEMIMYATDLKSAILLKADDVTVQALKASLEATSTDLNAAKDVLTKQCGIVLDSSGANANVNISSLKKKTDQQGVQIAQNSTNIQSVSTSLSASINAVAKTAGKNGEKIASLELRTTDTESALNAKADKVTFDAKVTTINSNIVKINGKIETLNAEIANIRKLVADEINALKGNVEWLRSKNIHVGSVVAGNVYADNYVTAASISMGGKLVATRSWVFEQLANYAKTNHSHNWSSITGKPSTL